MAYKVVNPKEEDKGRMDAAIEWAYGDSLASRNGQGIPSKDNDAGKPVAHIQSVN